MPKPFDVDKLVNYFAGECSPAEQIEIEAWIHASPENEAAFQRLRRVWESTNRPGFSGDIERLWDDMASRIDKYEEASSANTAGRDRRAPASRDRQTARQRGSERRPAAPKRSERQPAPAPSPAARRRGGSRLRGWDPVARILTFAVLVGIAVFATIELRKVDTSAPAEVAMRTISTEPGQRATVTLRDGTEVYLSAATTLTLPEVFSPERREVQLEGEAYFNVVRDEDRPFVLHAGDAHVQVLGTAFNVQAYPDEPQVGVVVEEGRVAVRPLAAPATSSSVVGAGQMTSVRDTVMQPIVSVDVYRHLAWREGLLVFESASFDEVDRKLERWYGLDVRLIGSAPVASRLTASFKDESLGEILGVIGAAMGLAVEREGPVVKFSGAEARR